MEISKAFRDVFRKKFERLKKEEQEQAMGQVKPSVVEAPTIGETQQKFYEVMKKNRHYQVDLGIDYQGQPLDLDMNLTLSDNEDKAFKQLLDELVSAFQSQDPEYINNILKEIYKILKQKEKDYSIEFISALVELFNQLADASGLIASEFEGQAPRPGETLAQQIDRMDKYKKWDKLTTLFGSIKLYLEKRAVRQLPTEYEAPTMEGLTGQGRRRRAIRKNAHKK